MRKEFTRLKQTDEYSWLNRVSNNVTKQDIKDACNAYKRFFNGSSKFPQFKTRKYSTPAFYQDNVKIRFSDTHVKVEGFATSKKTNKQRLNWIRLAEHGRIPAENVKYINPRIKYDGVHWYITVGIEYADIKSIPTGSGIGIDLGLKDLRSAQITSAIVKRKPSYICIEDLNVKGMMKNRHLSRAIQQQCFGKFKQQIIYKASWNSVPVIIADRFFPSSKLCSCCGNIKKDLRLSDRIYKCECGNVIDRDHQAALNLKKYGEDNLKQSVI